MKSPQLLLVLAILFAAAPLQARESKRIHETVDPYTGIRTLSLEIPTHGCPDDHPLGPYAAHVRLVVSAIEMQPGQVSYLLATDLVSRHMKLPDAQHATLDTSMDGASQQLGPGYPKTKHTIRSAWSGRHVQEMVPFDVTPGYLQRLSNAQDFHFRVNAKYDGVQRCADAHDLREFLGHAATY